LYPKFNSFILAGARWPSQSKNIKLKFLSVFLNASSAVLDLINNDEEFEEIRRNNLQAYDFPVTPQNTWIDKEGKPTDTARNATKQLIKKLAEEKGVNYKIFKGFKEILE